MIQTLTKSAVLLAVLTLGYSASASLLWKNQARFDQLKQERQQAMIQLEMKSAPIPDSLKTKELSKTQKTAKSPYFGEENPTDLKNEIQRTKKAKKIIGALRNLSPNKFLEVFNMKKPDFSSTN